jgi:hypothetical protein
MNNREATVEEPEIVDAAEALLARFGEGASLEAWSRMNEYFESKNFVEAGFWSRVALTVFRLEILTPGRSVH